MKESLILDKVKKLIEKENYTEAKKILTDSAIAPEDIAEFNLLMGKILDLTKEYKNALPFFRKAFELKRDSEYLIILLKALYYEKNIEELIDLYNKNQDLEPDRFLKGCDCIIYIKAQISLRNKDYQTAEKEIELFLKDNPENPLFIALKADLLFATGKKDQFIEYLQKLYNLFKTEENFLILIDALLVTNNELEASQLLKQHRYLLSQENYELCINKITPKVIAAVKQASDCRDYKSLITNLKAAFELNSTSENLENLIREYFKAIDRAKNSHLGTVYFVNLFKVMQYLNLVDKDQSKLNDPDYLLLVEIIKDAEKLIEDKKITIAERLVKYLYQAFPGDAKCQSLYGEIVKLTKSYQEAIKHYETAYKLDNDINYLTLLYNFYIEAGLLNQAKQCISVPKNRLILTEWGYNYSMAEILYKEKNYKLAERYYKAALELQALDVLVLNGLAATVNRLGKEKEAQDLYEILAKDVSSEFERNCAKFKLEKKEILNRYTGRKNLLKKDYNFAKTMSERTFYKKGITENYLNDLYNKIENIAALKTILDGAVRIFKNNPKAKIILLPDLMSIDHNGDHQIGISYGVYNSKSCIYLDMPKDDSDKTLNKLKGTIVHELTHMICQKLYQNRSLPFRLGDLAAKAKFKKVEIENLEAIYKFLNSGSVTPEPLTIISLLEQQNRSLSSKNHISDDEKKIIKEFVEVYINYKEFVQPSELVVLIPQLLAEGIKPETLAKVVGPMYRYHQEELLPNIKQYLSAAIER